MDTSIKTILCFGDSNTWGYIPGSDKKRYPKGVRWTSVLQNLLGASYEVISEGLSGRVIKSSKASPHKNGMSYILPCLLSHDPVDTVILMLGTNDVKHKYELSPEDIAKNLEEKISIIKNSEIENRDEVKIIIVCPPPIVEAQNEWHHLFNMDAMVHLQKHYRDVAVKYGCAYINAGEYISSSPLDGVHFDEKAHLKLAEVLKEIIL